MVQRSRRGRKRENSDDAAAAGKGTPHKQLKPRNRPNYFICLRLSDRAALTSRLRDLQGQMVAAHPGLAPLLVSAKLAHLTLFVLELPDDAAVANAQRCLSSCAAIAQSFFSKESPARCTVRGLGSFGEAHVCLLPLSAGVYRASDSLCEH